MDHKMGVGGGGGVVVLFCILGKFCDFRSLPLLPQVYRANALLFDPAALKWLEIALVARTAATARSTLV